MKNKIGFFERVYQVVRSVPIGKVTTYGSIARALGTRDARRVGHALHANSYQGDVPCHRVVNVKGEMASGFAFGGSNEQKYLLMSEGVEFVDDNRVDLKKCLMKF